MADPGAPPGRCSIAILCRAPVPGRAKTRLVPRLGAEGAAALHAILARRAVRTALDSGLPTTVWCAPDPTDPFFEGLLDLGPVVLRAQPAGDLGGRMHAVLREHLSGGGTAIAIGTDCPGLTAGRLREARDALQADADAAFVPAEDGGYALVALARPERRLFEGVPWGTSTVMEATRERVRSLGWRALELPPSRDVDRPDDVDWLLGAGILDPDEQRALDRLARR